jgi:signal transduction histidine kinase
METWILIGKLSLLSYCIIEFAAGGAGNATAVVLALLVYICLNLTGLILAGAAAGKVLCGLSVVLLLGCLHFLSGLFVLLLPFNLYELAFYYSAGLRLPAALAAAPLPLLARGEWARYLLVCVLSYLIYSLSHQSHRRLQALAGENQRLKEKVSALSGSLERNADLQRQVKYSSQLEERNKIAQEIHDRVGHAMAGSLLQLEAARLLMDKDRDRSAEIIQGVLHTLREGMESIRATLGHIKPAAGQLGINRLKLMADQFASRHRIKTSLVHKGDLERVSPAQWKIILDNTGEALTNTLKYAGATAVTIHIEVLHKLIKAEVRDNGPGAYTVRKGLGIKGMEERSGNGGGKVIIDGSKGFSVITLLPLEEDAHGHQAIDS